MASAQGQINPSGASCQGPLEAEGTSPLLTV